MESILKAIKKKKSPIKRAGDMSKKSTAKGKTSEKKKGVKKGKKQLY